MSGIFVEAKDKFDITVFYKIKPDNKIEISEEAAEGFDELTVKFSYPDYQTSQRIIQASMKPSLEGGASMDIFALQQNMLIGLAREWSAKDKDGKEIPVTPTSIGNLRIEIARALVGKLMAQVGDLL